LSQVSETIFAKCAQADARGDHAAKELLRALGNKHLSAPSEGSESKRAIRIWAAVIAVVRPNDTAVNRHAYAERSDFVEVLEALTTLQVNCCFDRIERVVKDRTEVIAASREHDPSVCLDHFADEVFVAIERCNSGIAVPIQKPRGADHVGDQERHSPAR
jgi:hypothetical protein